MGLWGFSGKGDILFTGVGGWVGAGGLKCQINLFFSFQLDGGINGRCQSCSKVPCIHLDKCYCCSAAAPFPTTRPAWWVEAV